MPTLHCRILTVGRHCTERASEPTTSFQVCCAECSLCLPHLNSSGKIEAHHPIIAALVAAGANVNAQSRADRATPLVVASYYDSGWAVLLEAGADPTVAATCVCALRFGAGETGSALWRYIRTTLHRDCPHGCAQIARRMAVAAAPGVHPDTNHVPSQAGQDPRPAIGLPFIAPHASWIWPLLAATHWNQQSSSNLRQPQLRQARQASKGLLGTV